MPPQVHSPRSLTEALDQLRCATAQSRLLAGGTDLMVELQTGRTAPDLVIDLWQVLELRGIRVDRDGLRLGALTTCADLLREPLVKHHADILAQAAGEVGAEQIRNRATIGGNLGTASPAADLNPVLMVLGAEVRLRSAHATRDLPVAAFIRGYRETARRPDELIESVWIPSRPTGERRAFRKVGTRQAQSIAKVVLAITGTVEHGRVKTLTAAAGSIAAQTVLVESLTKDLVGTAADCRSLQQAARRAAIGLRPIDDVRSTAAYRRQVFFRICTAALAAVLIHE